MFPVLLVATARVQEHPRPSPRANVLRDLAEERRGGMSDWVS